MRNQQRKQRAARGGFLNKKTGKIERWPRKEIRPYPIRDASPNPGIKRDSIEYKAVEHEVQKPTGPLKKQSIPAGPGDAKSLFAYHMKAAKQKFGNKYSNIQFEPYSRSGKRPALKV